MRTIFIFFTAIFLCAAGKLFAQQPEDALRYSYFTENGTARNQAIGGAGSSLGGEFSTMFENPAGIGFYKTSEFVFTPGYVIQKNKSTYKNSLNNASKNNFEIGTTGFIFSLPDNNSGSKIKNYTIGLGINRTANFNNYISYQGLNNQSSYSEKYLEELVNNNVTDPNQAAVNYPFGSSLAFNTFLIDTLQDANGNISGYKSLSPVATGVYQQSTIQTSGGITDIALAAAMNFGNKFYFGGNITVPVLNYSRDSHFTESDATTDTTNDFNYFEVHENLQTKGYGINIKLGFIYSPVQDFRLGLAFHSPTFYELTDSYSTEITTDLEGYGGSPNMKTQNSGSFNNDLPGQIKYNLVTPWRMIASASYVFTSTEDVKKQKGFITADAEYVNYKASSFEAIDNGDVITSDYFSVLNKVIDQQYKGTFNFRVGGELKFNILMVRLGGAYYGNPYKDDKANRTRLSAGLGYRDKGIFADLTYVYSINNDVNYPYRLQDKANDPAFIKNNTGNIVATIGFKL